VGSAPPQTLPASRRRGGGGGCPARAAGRRGHRDEATESDEGDATSDLLLKHPDTILATYVCRQMKYLKHASETLTKTPEKHFKIIVKIYATTR
jgi:hypothetical protein